MLRQKFSRKDCQSIKWRLIFNTISECITLDL